MHKSLASMLLFLVLGVICCLTFCAVRPEDILYMFQVFPFRRHIKIHHQRKDHTVIAGSRKVLEDDLTQIKNGFAVIPAEDLDHGFNGHMVVEKPQVRDLHQFLPDSHLSDGCVAQYEYKLHVSPPRIRLHRSCRFFSDGRQRLPQVYFSI